MVPVLYILIPSLFYLVLYKWMTNPLSDRKIQKMTISTVQRSRERRLTISSLVIFCITGFLTGLLYRHNMTFIYFDVFSYGVIYFCLSIVWMIFLHDTYFYWTHRLLHRPVCYEKIHITHHLSTNPDPWTALAFHPVEAAIQAAILPLIVCVLPAHPLAILFFAIYKVLMNVLGHSGYGLFPDKAWLKKWFWWITTSRDHDAHHQYGHGNFGLYFTLWDKWMNTSQQSAGQQS